MSKLIGVICAIAITVPAFASDEVLHSKAENKHQQESLAPAKRYDGSTPIDLSNGRLGSNGTIGQSNAEYESLKTSELSAPGVFAAPYPYEAKSKFVASVKERLRFFEEAVTNLKDNSKGTRPESEQFANRAAPQIEEKLEQAKKMLKTASSAGESEWRNAEHDAHNAFNNLKTTYESMMKTHAEAK